jgi:4-hydroxy-tetrahydrodipicolinate synthase
MNQRQLRGTGVALVTPFANGKIDFPALGRIIEHNIEGGVDYLVSLGTTGESVTLSTQECREVVDFTLKTVADRVPIVVGVFGGNDTRVIVERIQNYNFDGIFAIMSSSPNYTKPSQEGLFQHYMAIAEASPLPIIIYNVPGRTASNIEPTTLLRIAKASDKFIAVKEASGDMLQVQQILKHRPDHFLVISGDDPTALATVACGGDGVISVIGNAFPKECSTMIRSALTGDYATAQRLNLALFDMHEWLYFENNPGGIKATLAMLGFCKNELRLPLVPISQMNFDKLQKEVEKISQKHTSALPIS